VTAAAALLVLLALAGCQRSDEYPNRPITLVCPWSVGGGTDQVSRQAAMLLEQELGVPVNVINATGGAGVTGHQRGALARPDGYTLTMATIELNMLHWRGLTKISHRDFEPVGMLNSDAAALFVRSDAPWQSLKELDEHIRANPGEMRVSGTAYGGIWHLAFAGWLDHIGLKPNDAIWVSINGAAPSLQELIAGGVDVACCSLPEAQALLESDRIRSLGVMADKRVEQFPDVPTFRELGVDWVLTGWRGICLPEGTPPDVTERVVAALQRVVEREEFRGFMQSAGFDITWKPAGEFEALMAEVDAQLGKLLTSEAFQSIRKTRFGPMFFPKVLGVLLGAVVVVLLATGGLRRADNAEPLTPRGVARSAGVVLWVTAFLLLVDELGFVITAAVLLTAFLLALGTRWWKAPLIAAIVTVVTYQLFAVVLRVPLPHGWLGW
jgi:tripartite-type tricarboxylate transporter receptor subunit TctC